MSQIALAERSRLTRQSVSAIEAGRAMPGVDVALRIAQALGCQVEELFGAAAPACIEATGVSAELTGRVAMAHIGGRWVAYPLLAEGLRIAADGLVVGRRRQRLSVEPMRSASEARENIVIVGCAAGLGLLCDRLNAGRGSGRFLWFSRSSTAALSALAKSHAHVAGVHLVDQHTGEGNIEAVRRVAFGEPVVLITLARWEAGLVMQHQQAKSIRGVADLGRRGLRLVIREPGSGAQRLLEREARAAGHPVALVRSAKLKVAGHLEVAQAVAMGAAETGVATRDAAIAFGLHFVPLAEERFDLVLPSVALSEPRIQHLLNVVVSAALARELSSLGYDVRSAGQRVGDVHVA